MKLVKRSDIVKGVPKRWAETYDKDYYQGTDKIEILKNLRACKDLTEENIAKIIGNNIWVFLACSECEKQFEELVMLGDEPDYDVSTLWVCKGCLIKATDLIK